jgi:hypothetical protein
MMRRSAAILLGFALAGCEGPHDLIYNMTACPIVVAYSAANIRNNTVTLPPGGAAGGTGVVAPNLDEVTIVDGSGARHEYSANALSGLRASGSAGGRWAYFPDGLRFLKGGSAPMPSEKTPGHSC